MTDNAELPMRHTVMHNLGSLHTLGFAYWIPNGDWHFNIEHNDSGFKPCSNSHRMLYTAQHTTNAATTNTVDACTSNYVEDQSIVSPFPTF